MSKFFRNIVLTMEMIKWEHSIFALPFALTGAVLAAGGLPSVRITSWIIVCMVSARTAAMAFNRLIDAEIDRENPRTANRAIPVGSLSKSFVIGFVVTAAGVFLIGAGMLNRLCLTLAPGALLLVLGYSYMKRVTKWSHLVLGLALGTAPAAAWIAVRGSLDLRIVVLTLAVTLWVAGFDALYACQDVDHDRRAGLFSVPQTFGLEAAFFFARLAHVGVVMVLAGMILLFGLGIAAWVGLTVVAGLLMYEHLIVSPNDLRRLNAAFFTLNGVIAVVFFLTFAGDVLLRRNSGR